MPAPTYRAVLALHAGAVEAQRRHSVADPLDVEDALVPPLARLRLRQVLGLQRDGFNLPRWDQNLLRAHQLGTVLHEGQGHGAEQDEYSSALICLTSFLHIVSACGARWVVGSLSPAI